MAQGANPKRTVRLATKSLRVPELIRRAMQASPLFRGLMTYSVIETRFLSDQGFDDFLVAYPTVQPSDLNLVSELLTQGKQVRLVVDSEAQLTLIEAAWRGKTKLPLVIEADASLRWLGGAIHLGVRRSPVRTPDAVVALAERIQGSSAARFAGVMVYEAQVAGLPDRNPFKRGLNRAAGLVRKLSMRHVAKLREAIATQLKAKDLPLELFNGGGTGSLSYLSEELRLTEVTAGSALFCPHLFDYYSNLEFEPSAFFALQVVRASDPGYVTCHGGGYVASGEAGRDRLPKPYAPKGLSLVTTEGVGEVQTPLRGSGDLPKVGNPVLFRHAKAGELMERFAEVRLVSKGRIVKTVPTYRGQGLTTI